MSGRVLRFEGSSHREAERLLPWLVNGTLAGEERRLVERHLAECASCQRELAWLTSLRLACTSPAAGSAADVDLDWQRMRRRLAGEHRPRPRAAAAIHGRGRGRPRATYWRLAAAAQALAIAVLGALLVHGHAAPGATYRTLGAAPAPSAQLAVVFDPHISEAQWRSLIRASQARIVDGPTESGAYVLSVPRAHAASIREALRAARGVILVESLSGGGR